MVRPVSIDPDRDIQYVPAIWSVGLGLRVGRRYTSSLMVSVGYSEAMSRPTQTSLQALLVRVDKAMVDDEHFVPTTRFGVPYSQWHPLEQMRLHAEQRLRELDAEIEPSP